MPPRDMARYRNRAAAIAIADGHLLVMHRVHPVYGEYYVFPGGGIEQGENPADTVRREVREEMGLTVSVGREVIYGSTPQGFIQHYYLVETPKLPVSLPSHAEENAPERLRRRGTYEPMWIPVSKIRDITLQPMVVAKKLQEFLEGTFPMEAVDVGALYPDA